ncbi:MAG: DUF547 domain-containing protein [Pseudomonadota bacterium]
MKKLLINSVLLVFLTGCAGIERLAIPNPTLIDEELVGSGMSGEPDHGVWDRFLKTYLREDTEGPARVAYAQVSAQDRAGLDQYIAALSSLDASQWNRDAQLAYWANLYNAKTVSVILEYYPVDSIRQIKDGLLDLGPWNDKRLTVNGRSLSLHNIEHGIVRPLWAETPEIHYILNCAAVGCPTLVNYAYDADNIAAALQTNAQTFINSDRGITVDERGRLVLSKIYLWYLDDFGGSRSALVEHLLEYASGATRKKIADGRSPVRYAYDWSLNEAGKR